MHTQRDVVLFVDMKIYAMLQHFMYGASNLQYNLPQHRSRIGLTYGIWLAYKYACTITL